MMDQNSPSDDIDVKQTPLDQQGAGGELRKPRTSLAQGNRETIVDLYVKDKIENDPKDYAFKVYIRLNAKKQSFKNVNFQHSIFDTCYFNKCIFDSCDFTGCRFVGCNLHQSAFSGCKFEYAVFERCQIDDDILEREAPQRENLKMRFARTLRMNFQQIGDAKAVNKAISLELVATESYLKKSWSSSETYYREKYPGWKRVPQFFKWLEFRVLDAIWGNGESTLKLLRTILVIHMLIAAYDTIQFRNPWDIKDYALSLAASPGIFFGIANPHAYPIWFSSLVGAARLLGFAFLTAILVKRFGRR